MRNTFKGVIFDFDCTLADSKQGMYKCVTAVLKKMNYPAPHYGDVIKTIGIPPEKKFTFLTNVNDHAEQLKFKTLYLELINPPSSFFLPFSILFPETIELLTLIKSLGCKIAIVSTKTRFALKQELMHLRLMRFIDSIQAGDDVSHPKPNPQGILNVLSQWKMVSDEVLYIGDHAVDAAAAMAANIHFIGLTTGTTSEIELKKYPHMLVTDNLKNIFQIFLDD